MCASVCVRVHFILVPTNSMRTLIYNNGMAKKIADLFCQVEQKTFFFVLACVPTSDAHWRRDCIAKAIASIPFTEARPNAVY